MGEPWRLFDGLRLQAEPAPDEPGGARFVPEVVHNKSGVGSAFEVMDMNKDNVPDIATAGAYGAFVFLSRPGARAAAPAPAAAPKK